MVPDKENDRPLIFFIARKYRPTVSAILI